MKLAVAFCLVAWIAAAQTAPTAGRLPDLVDGCERRKQDLPFVVEKQVVAPAFFMTSGTQYVVAQHADGTPVGSAAPARAGEEIVLYGTGFGPTNPPAASNQLVTTPFALANPVYMTVGGVP